jgi:hypothetical protein
LGRTCAIKLVKGIERRRISAEPFEASFVRLEKVNDHAVAVTVTEKELSQSAEL